MTVLTCSTFYLVGSVFSAWRMGQSPQFAMDYGFTILTADLAYGMYQCGRCLYNRNKKTRPIQQNVIVSSTSTQTQKPTTTPPAVDPNEEGLTSEETTIWRTLANAQPRTALKVSSLKNKDSFYGATAVSIDSKTTWEKELKSAQDTLATLEKDYRNSQKAERGLRQELEQLNVAIQQDAALMSTLQQSIEQDKKDLTSLENVKTRAQAAIELEEQEYHKTVRELNPYGRNISQQMFTQLTSAQKQSEANLKDLNSRLSSTVHEYSQLQGKIKQAEEKLALLEKNVRRKTEIEKGFKTIPKSMEEQQKKIASQKEKIKTQEGMTLPLYLRD